VDYSYHEWYDIALIINMGKEYPKGFDELRKTQNYILALSFCDRQRQGIKAAEKCIDNELGSICVSSSIAFTHPREKINQLDYVKVLYGQISSIAASVALNHIQTSTQVPFDSKNPLKTKVFTTALDEAVSAWILWHGPEVKGHLIGLVKARTSDEYFVWDTTMNFKFENLYSTSDVLKILDSQLKRKQYEGKVISFRNLPT